MQMTLARHLGLVMHLASGRRHFCKRHNPIAFPSAALAGAMVERGDVGGAIMEKERVRATIEALNVLQNLDITLS